MNMRCFALLALMALGACADGPDEDGDGYGNLSDCDDTNANVYPGAEPDFPTCSDNPWLDYDCDGREADDCCGDNFCVETGPDIDFDGRVGPADCDETNPSVYEGAIPTFEICEEDPTLDYNCDGVFDDCCNSDRGFCVESR